jgi:hypothetical protein
LAAKLMAMSLNRVQISAAVGSVLIRAAIRGYEAPYKEERLGILLGSVRGDTAFVNHAKLYLGGNRTRTAADVDGSRFTRRVRELCRAHASDFLGTFHTHNEVAKTITSALSLEDRDHLCSDPPHRVELIVAVWASNVPSRQGQRYIQIDVDGYRLRIAGYQMRPPFNLIPVYWRGVN